jgi:tripartite-type tricarboxylate transporter receptor subunit TctC
MKANPGKALLANQTAAAQTSGIQLQELTGTTLQLIPYRGAGPALTDLLAGNVDLMVSQAAAVLSQVRGGSLKAIANLSPQRSRVMPEIPTADESGVRGLYTSGWFGLFAPKGISNEAIGKLNGAMVETLADPAIRARLAELGLDVASREQQTPQGLAEFYKAEVNKWWPILKAANIKGE